MSGPFRQNNFPNAINTSGRNSLTDVDPETGSDINFHDLNVT